MISKAAIALVLTLSFLALKTTETEAKSSILFCGSPGRGTCTPYQYRTHGGKESLCAQKGPCYFSSNCEGDHVCENHRPSKAN